MRRGAPLLSYVSGRALPAKAGTYRFPCSAPLSRWAGEGPGVRVARSALSPRHPLPRGAVVVVP